MGVYFVIHLLLLPLRRILKTCRNGTDLQEKIVRLMAFYLVTSFLSIETGSENTDGSMLCLSLADAVLFFTDRRNERKATGTFLHRRKQESLFLPRQSPIQCRSRLAPMRRRYNQTGYMALCGTPMGYSGLGLR